MILKYEYISFLPNQLITPDNFYKLKIFLVQGYENKIAAIGSRYSVHTSFFSIKLWVSKCRGDLENEIKVTKM